MFKLCTISGSLAVFLLLPAHAQTVSDPNKPVELNGMAGSKLHPDSVRMLQSLCR
jgi:hypothetical protein